MLEQIPKPLVRLVRRPEPRELAHRPQPAPVHRRIHPTRERERPRIAQIALVVQPGRLRRRQRLHLHARDRREQLPLAERRRLVTRPPGVEARAAPLLDACHVRMLPRPAGPSPERGILPRFGDADRGMVKFWGHSWQRVTATVLVTWAAPFGTSAAASATGCGSGAHGSAGYAYAGLQSSGASSGVRATITPLRAPSVKAGHAAAWIGLGGRGAGRSGETMWLQVGVAALPNTPTMIYAEITRAGRDPVFLPLVQSVQVGQSHRLAVLEMNRRPGVWRVGRRRARHRPDRARGLAQALEADRDRRVVERRRRHLQRLRLPLRARRGRAVARRLLAHVRAGRHLPRPRLRPPAAPARRAASGRCPRTTSRPTRSTRRRRSDRPARPAVYAATILTGVPTRTSLRSATMSLFRSRTQPCETAWPISHGAFVPWTPTTPPPGQSDSFE